MVSATCLRFLKMTVFALNLIMGLLGIVGVCVAGFFLYLMVQGTHDDRTSLWAGSFSDADQMIQQSRAVMCIFTLVTGSAMIIVGFFGCCGAATENKCLLVTFAGLIGVILAVEILVIGVIIWQKDQAPDVIDELILTKIRYSEDYGHEDWRPIHAIQRHLRCCGVNGYHDYIEVNHTVPLSCCNHQLVTDKHYHECSYYIHTHPYMISNDTLLFKRGCRAVVRADIDNFAMLGYSVIGIIMFIQVVSFVFCCVVIRYLGAELSEVEEGRPKPAVDRNRSSSYVPADEVQQYRAVPPAYENPSKSSLGASRTLIH